MRISETQQSREEIMQILQDEIYAFGDVKLLAVRCGLSSGTIYSIRSGRTSWPRWITFKCLIDVLDLRLTLSRYKKGN